MQKPEFEGYTCKNIKWYINAYKKYSGRTNIFI